MITQFPRYGIPQMGDSQQELAKALSPCTGTDEQVATVSFDKKNKKNCIQVYLRAQIEALKGYGILDNSPYITYLILGAREIWVNISQSGGPGRKLVHNLKRHA